MSIMRKPSAPHKHYAHLIPTAVKTPKTAETKENIEFRKYRAEKEKMAKDPSMEIFRDQEL